MSNIKMPEVDHTYIKRYTRTNLCRVFRVFSIALIIGLFVLNHSLFRYSFTMEEGFKKQQADLQSADTASNLKKTPNFVPFEARYNFTVKDLESAQQDLPALITYIKQHHMKLPDSGPYKLANPRTKDFSNYKQSTVLANMHKNKRGGVFVEAGGYDGEGASNTLYFERELGWTGLLIEPNPVNFWRLRHKGRKAHAIETCLSLVPFPREVSFTLSNAISQITNVNKGAIISVQCFPLYSILMAFGNSTIDVLALDLEGVELKVLKTIPWEKVDIKTIIAEIAHIPEGTSALTTYLSTKGYVYYKKVGYDVIYAKKNFPL